MVRHRCSGGGARDAEANLVVAAFFFESWSPLFGESEACGSGVHVSSGRESGTCRPTTKPFSFVTLISRNRIPFVRTRLDPESFSTRGPAFTPHSCRAASSVRRPAEHAGGALGLYSISIFERQHGSSCFVGATVRHKACKFRFVN
jgi:hypothetical protein